MQLEVEVCKVIITRLARRGTGREDDPVRIVTQVWTMNGHLLFETDGTICTYDEDGEAR